MSLYSEKLMSAVRGLNDPIKSTSTTTVQGNEGLDLSGILMMLMMNNMFKKPTTPTAGTSGLDAMPFTQSWGSVPNALGAGAVPGLANSTGGGIQELMTLLASLGKVI